LPIVISGGDILRIPKKYRKYRYAKIAQHFYGTQTYRFAGEISNAQAQLRFGTAKTSSAARC
jgi:hypothetical protein